ncbi:hypothetical protein [Calidifontibacillus oryziterrae]|uniref:hypothetical protein n=1 Tax=Calidifontibacillus oryziterrae TaxID=1191699 RepID=UPI0002E9C0AF|nr:hypothetical protein [Calidifontibacillus oryziterrae]
MELQQINKIPEIEYTKGFAYLFHLLSHLTSSKNLFEHKIHVIMELSRSSTSSTFSKADIESMIPQYPAKDLESIVTSLIDGGWLKREEGTLSYQFTNPGLLFTRFLPFLYQGDQLDDQSFQSALKDMMNAAEKMNLSLTSLEFMRDQAIHSVQRNIEEIKGALISKNEEKIYEARQKLDAFLQNIDDFLIRFKQINDFKRLNNMDITESDKNSIEFLLSLELKINELFDYRRQSLINSISMGNGIFTKKDIDRFIYQSSFKSLSNLLNNIVYTPSQAQWIDEDEIIEALGQFLNIVKPLNSSRNISKRVYGIREEQKSISASFLDKTNLVLENTFSENNLISLEKFLLQFDNKVDLFMHFAALCYLDSKKLLRYQLQTIKKAKSLNNSILKTVSIATIERRE